MQIPGLVDSAMCAVLVCQMWIISLENCSTDISRRGNYNYNDNDDTDYDIIDTDDNYNDNDKDDGDDDDDYY